MNPEVFYLDIGGEQRGPYTIPQIDHQLNVGLIGLETLFWREGMEDWQPITNLVTIRHPQPRKTSWLRRAIVAAILLVLVLLGRLFGPIALVGWRETAQYDFSPHAAYWRARDVVRHQALPAGSVISFSPESQSRVEMVEEPPGARVKLHTKVAPNRHAEWNVTLAYDTHRKEWTGQSVREASP